MGDGLPFDSDTGRRGSQAGSVPGSQAGSVPGSQAGSVPGSQAGSVPGSQAGSVPGSQAGSVPGSETTPRDRRHSLGDVGERLAAEHLVRCGYQILERNYRTRWGELDLIAYDGQALVFCEVKTRRSGGRKGSPFEALGPAKQVQVRKIASRWLHERCQRPRAAVIRFDAIGVTFDGADRLLALEHLEGAF